MLGALLLAMVVARQLHRSRTAAAPRDDVRPRATDRTSSTVDAAGAGGPGGADRRRESGDGAEHAESLLNLMRHRREGFSRLFATFRHAHDPKRGAAVLLLVEELANLHAIRCELYRPLLRRYGEEGEALLARFDQLSEPVQVTLAELDSRTSGVGPMDVLVSDPGKMIELVERLAGQVEAYDRFEAEELGAFLRARVDLQDLEELGQRASALKDKEQVHPHPGRRPADEQLAVLKRAQAVYDRMRNKTSHPRQALSGGGEAGP